MRVLSLEDWALNWHPLETETSEHLWITSVYGIIPCPWFTRYKLRSKYQAREIRAITVTLCRVGIFA